MVGITDPVIVYVFRDQSFSGGGDTTVCAAPQDVVVSVFGGGEIFETAGVGGAFGGSAFFRNDETGQAFIGVWGARKASRFRNLLRTAGITLQIKHEPPPARLIVRSYGRARKERL